MAWNNGHTWAPLMLEARARRLQRTAMTTAIADAEPVDEIVVGAVRHALTHPGLHACRRLGRGGPGHRR
ncbi:hypothetical protein [Streptomonospora wellingtoniae]|uniref:Uncharacterized protein n=1 Tax=Streptomonospora wellingtoniae TaxID=3075544 RepID=A0ABU2KY79_9ACTN|nr:hypothetical protein [Streptomonospora sp. DSM 45055]MDT0304262.1 hypothetical protein [Streptomonospora sp. DSM 45055]